MKYNVLQDAVSKNKSHKRKRNWQKIVTFMAAIVVFCTTYALILPAITMSVPLTCGQEEHIHTQDCYVMIGETPRLTCDKAEHAHDDVLCYIDTEADVETASTWEGTLPKQLSGVYANDLVAIAESQLGYTESARNIVIGEDNTLQGYTRYGAWAGEKYGDWNSTFLAFVLEHAGLTEEEYPRSVNCELWKSTLEAEKLFHTLREGYLPVAGDILFLDTDGDAAADRVGLVTGVTTDESGVLEVLAIEGNTGSSDRKLNETAVMALSVQLPEAVSDSDDTVSGNDAAVSAGDSSLGENSYPSNMTQISSPEGYKGGCVDSTSYLLSDERIVGFATMPEQTFYCLKEGHVHTDLCYMQKLNCKITAQDHVHSALCYERGDLLCEKEEHVHTQECSRLPAYVYHYEDEQVQVEVEIPEECGVPADAELIVTAIGEEHTGYASLVQEAEAAIEGNVAGIRLYDISFYTTEGTYLPVSDRAKVVIRFKEQVVDPTAEVAVLHYDENDTSARVLENVTIEEQAVTVKTDSKIEEDAQAISLFSLFSARETVPQEEEITEERVLDENGEVVTETVVTFETDGFSTFAVVQVETGVYIGAIYTPETSGFTIDGHKALTQIVDSGKQFMIVTADKKYALSGYAYLDGNGNDKLRGMQVLDTNTEGGKDQIYVNANKHLLWEFLPTNHKGRVYIRNVATGEYLQLVRNNVAITTQLLSEEEFKNQQMIYAMKDDAADSNIVAFCAVNNTQDVDNTANEIAGVDYYYLNRDGGGKFHTLQGSFDNTNNQFLLYEYEYKGKDNIDTGTDQNPSVTIPDLNAVYLLAGINYNDEYDGGNNSLPTILTGTWDGNNDVNVNNEGTVKRSHLKGEIAKAAEYKTQTVSFLTYTGNNYRWIFEKVKDKADTYYIKNADLNQYLNLNGDGLSVGNIAQEITLENVTGLDNTGDKKGNPVVQKNVVRLKATVNNVTYYVFLNGNRVGNEFTAINTYRGKDLLGQHATHMVLYEYGNLVDGLEGKNYIISGVNNKDYNGKDTVDNDNTRTTAAMLTPETDNANTGLAGGWTGLKSTTNATKLTYKNDAVTNLQLDADKSAYDYAWTFEYAGYGTYYIKSLKTGQYLNIANHSLTLSGDKQPIEVIQASQSTMDMTIKKNIICLRNLDNEYVILYDNKLGNAFSGQYSKAGDNLNANRGTELILTEYRATEESELATDLGGKVYFVASVNDNIVNDKGIPILSSAETGGNTIHYTKDIAEDGASDFDPTVIDPNGVLGLVFEQTDKPGTYHIKSVANGKYLNLKTKNEAVSFEATPQDIEVIGANTNVTSDNLTITTNVVSLRTNIGGKYYYVHLGNANVNNSASGFHSRSETDIGDNAESILATHFRLVEIPEVNEVVGKINTLLDNMVQDADGSWKFSAAGLTGSAAPGNADDNQGTYSDNYQQPFMDNYDQAQAYRREQQLLARKIRELYAKLTPAEQRYVWRYEIIDSNGNNEKDLKWLWDEVKVVTPNSPSGVKVELFNYDESVNNTGLAFGRGDKSTEGGGKGSYNDPKGFTFYHKVMFDEYTMMDRGRDEYRNDGGFGGTLGSDDKALNMDPRLDADGYPVVTGGANAANEFKTDNNGGTGSLKYLFDPEGDYHVATMTDGGGLFQKDDEGYYYYYANQNAAYYSGTVGPVDTDGDGIADKTKVEDGGHFILYDTVIRPMYVHGYQPANVNDVYNFLPFNNPYDDLIFDEPNTIPSNTVKVANTDENGKDRVNTKGNKYEGAANNTANIARSGYLNERVDLWFGMTIELEFLMPENGQLYYYNENNELDHIEDMLFDFYGDDDVWVYIDDQLVLDIGGVHGAEKGYINFHTGAVYYEDSSSKPVNTTLAEIFKGSGVELEGDTFADYTRHTLKFFYMERGGNVSYCGLKFNMPTLPVNYLMVDKQLAELEDEKVIDADVIGDKYYTFRVVQANADRKPIDKDGNETDKVEDMVPFFEPYASFEVYRGGAPTGIVGKTSEDGFFSVKAGYQAVFSDMLNHRRDETKTHYVVQEILFDGDMEQLDYITYKVSTLEDGSGTQEGSRLEIKREDLGFFMGEKISGAAYTNGVDAGESSSIRFTNVLKAPDSKLAIIKKLGEGVDESQYKDTEFTIKLEFGDYAIMETAESTEDQPEVERAMTYSPVAQGTPYELYDKDGEIIKAENDDGFWKVASTDGTITLKPGQKAVFDGIVAGTYYRVSEQLAGSDSWMPAYTGKIYQMDKNGNIESEATNVNYPEGNANGKFNYLDYVEITIENTNYTVSVEIPLKKYVEYASMTDNFTFNVQWVRMKDENNDGKLDDGATYDLKWVNDLINDTTKTDAEKYYSLPGANITVTPKEATLGADGEVIIGFPDTSLTDGHAYYKISEQQGKGSYLYDTNYYIVEVTLKKDAANAADKAKITGIWKNGTEKIPVPGGNATIAALDFVNHRTTSLEVSKEVENENTRDTFNFEYTIRYPDMETEYKKGTFRLKHNEKHSITGIPVGAIVEVTEKDAEGYLPSYNVTAVYEAEYAQVKDAAVLYDQAASAGAYVGNINGKEQIVTIPVYTMQGIGADINFRYAQADSRMFFVDNSSDDVSGITRSFVSTGGWTSWNVSKAFSGPYMKQGENSLVIGGVDGEFAPNLDQIKLIFGRVQGDTAAVNILGDGSAIHFVNKPVADVTVSKTVEGSDLNGEFTFVATIKDAAGNPITSVTTGEGQVRTNADGKYEFKLTNEASLVFKKLPIGATIQVEETDKGNAISTYYRMTTRIEAEDGTLIGSADMPKTGNPSGGYFVGNIKGNKDTVTIPVQVKNPEIHALQVGYGTEVDRDLVITNNSIDNGETNSVTLEGLNSGGWWTWKETSTKITLVSGNNCLIFGGSGNGESQESQKYAPNLDYIALVWEGSGTDTGEEYINGNTQIHFTNEAGYELPESGGFGTTPYILGGIFTMLTAFVALLLYKKESGLIQRPGEPKRRKEERVPS